MVKPLSGHENLDENVTDSNFLNFFGTLNHIKKNYKKIQKDMMKNKLPTNKEFIEEFVKAIDDFK